MLSWIFSSKSIRRPSALRALRLVTRLATEDACNASYELFKMVMAPDDLTEQHWEAARLAIRGAFEHIDVPAPMVEEPKEILRFLAYHLNPQGAGGDHGPSIGSALEAILIRSWDLTEPLPQGVEYVRKFNWASPSIGRGLRLALHPDNSYTLRGRIVSLIALISDQWFNSPAPIMEPEEMSEFSEHLAVFVIDETVHATHVQRRGVTVLFEVLRSSEWRKHIVARFWSMFQYCARAYETRESVRWCLQNAIELLEFTRGLPDGEGLKWWNCALWFYYDKLFITVRDEVGGMARDMSSGDGLSDLNLYLNLMGQEVTRMRKEVDELIDYQDMSAEYGMRVRDRLVALEGNRHRLAQITGRRQ